MILFRARHLPRYPGWWNRWERQDDDSKPIWPTYLVAPRNIYNRFSRIVFREDCCTVLHCRWWGVRSARGGDTAIAHL